MDWQKVYKQKQITREEALSKIKSSDHVISALAAAEPKGILTDLHTIADRVQDVTVVTCLPMGGYEYYTNPAYKNSFTMEGWFYSPPIRKAHENRNVSFIPNHLHLAATKRLAHRKADVFIGTASAMDKHGYLSLSLSATYEVEMIKNADLVIIEVNDKMPRTFGDTIVHISDIDYIIEEDYDIPELGTVEPSEKDRIIGRHIADLIEDGSTIQLGIGGIPNAVSSELFGKKDLGIHTEMFTDGMVDLYNAGVINGSKKTLMPGKMVATFALGSKKLYDFIDDNPAVVIAKGSWTNDPYVIGQNYKMISINTTMEIDLAGQCCSESIGHRQFSGTGGQADTAIGAQKAKNGRSFIALYSTAMVKNKETGAKEEISKIVPMLKQGAVVSLSRNDVDFVVTEYGVASLRGTNIKERVERLIAIAHPKFREELRYEAHKIGLIYDK
jgi:acyl-CoA hydrolase